LCARQGEWCANTIPQTETARLSRRVKVIKMNPWRNAASNLAHASQHLISGKRVSLQWKQYKPGTCLRIIEEKNRHEPYTMTVRTVLRTYDPRRGGAHEKGSSQKLMVYKRASGSILNRPPFINPSLTGLIYLSLTTVPFNETFAVTAPEMQLNFSALS